MTIDEAIQHCKEQVQEQAKKGCYSCAEEHQQLAEWLKELKAYREQGGDAISRKYILDLIDTKGANLDDDLLIVEQWIQDAPSVNSQSIKCDDAISRREALNAITMAEVRWQAVDNVNKLPSVTPQQRSGRWILVSERLPEDSELVLFSTKTDRVFTGRYFDDDTDFQWYAFRDETFVEDNVVTAWMPLPQPYKAESEV